MQNRPQHSPDRDPQDQDAMAMSPEEQRRAAQQSQRDESGLPGGGSGRIDEVGRTGVYPLSSDEGAIGSAKVEPEEGFGQGDRGVAGYGDSGGSEIIPPEEPGEGDQ
jgi:hypothetical protein